MTAGSGFLHVTAPLEGAPLHSDQTAGRPGVSGRQIKVSGHQTPKKELLAEVMKRHGKTVETHLCVAGNDRGR